MDIYIIDPYQGSSPHFPIVGIASDYYSYIWNPQLYDLGYFELILRASPENISKLKPGRFLVRECDWRVDDGKNIYRNAMVIRTSAITWDPDQGYVLTVSGKTLKDVLNQRIVWNQILFDTEQTIPDIVAAAVMQNFSTPLQYAQLKQSEWEDELETAEDELADAIDAYNQAVSQYGEDSDQAKAALEVVDQKKEQKQYCIKEIEAWNRSAAQQAYRELDFIIVNNVYGTWVPPRAIVQFRGENIGDLTKQLCMDYKVGWEMELDDDLITLNWVIGEDRTSTVVFSPEYDNLLSSTYTKSMADYSNSGLVGGEGEGDLQYTAEFGSAAAGDRYEAWYDATNVTRNDGRIPEDKYIRMLRSYGKKQNAKYNQMTSMTGNVVVNGVYKIDEDYTLGDYVTLSNNGISSSVRLVELIYSDGESGTDSVAVFDE